MRERYIIDYDKDEKISDFFLVIEEGSIKETKQGKPYGFVKVRDKTKAFACKCWSNNLSIVGNELFESLIPGNIVYIEGKVDIYENNPQIIIDVIRLSNNRDIFDKSDLYKTAPVESNIIYDKIINIINTEINDIEYKTICKNLYIKHRNKLLEWPAAKGRHHAYKGGLLWHTYNMALLAIKVAEIYENVNKSLLLAGVLLHDIGKISELSFNNNAPDYSFEGNMLGHLLVGTMMINNASKINEFNMSKEKKILLEHLIASHHGQLEWDAIKEPCLLEAYILHYLDMIDSKVETIKDVLDEIEPGSFSSKKDHKIFIYKPIYMNE